MSKKEKTPPGEMIDMDIRFLSLVRKGANRQTIQIYKADEGDSLPEQEAGEAQPKKGMWARLVEFLKAEDPDGAEEISKAAAEALPAVKSFNARVAARELTDRMWAVNDALSQTIRDIINSPAIKDKPAEMSKAVDEYAAYMKKRIADAPLAKSDEAGFFAEEQPVEIEKSGRALSAKNMTAIKQAIAVLQGLIPDDGAESGPNGAQKEETDMTKEDITKAVQEAIKPLDERIAKLEKQDSCPEQQPAAGTGETSEGQTDADIIKAAVAEAVKPMAERIERIEKARGLSRTSDGEEKTNVSKSEDEKSVFDGFFA